MPAWYLRLTYRLGRTPHYYDCYDRYKPIELIIFCAVNRINCCLKENSFTGDVRIKNRNPITCIFG
jgi:hypothetical protein